ncbi:DivIVA domain-containing protein [Microbacterium protaetiae]|uniref:DivIVA domain-containing protein n=1 Tax=Microbacterium protaetiae TaxID=2509458 RepID=A0A4P6EJ11_9MICO|nr:DivIVA domain-containing protein [Microbacterium protaetiae]QAY60177.1 DivIVA domain-containing protein [Microbacterium protaetiae]
MSDSAPSADTVSFDSLIADSGAVATEFTTAFRGYDKDEVDAAIAELVSQTRAAGDEIAKLKDEQHRVAASTSEARGELERLRAQLAEADAVRAAEVERARAEESAARAGDADEATRLRDELTAAQAELASARKQLQTLTEELTGEGDSPNRKHFEEILRVAEEQASTLIKNASVQGDRLLEAAREEIDNRRTLAQQEAEAIIAQAQHEAAQVRLRIDTEVTAHEARLEREAAHAAEKVSQAEQEVAAIRAEAERGVAALRSQVTRETTRDRAEAEEAVRELRVRALEFEESLTRRQDDAHQEFLVLHNQAVAHAERITVDANEQVAASLEHAKRVSAKADDYERLARAQAHKIEADARVRAGEHLERSRAKSQKIIDLVTSHTQGVLRDAEDRTRQLRWQQHQLTSFMAEVKELIRPETSLGADAAADAASAEPQTAPDAATAVDDIDADAAAEVIGEAERIVEDAKD